MNKAEALSTILKCSLEYDYNLKNYNVLFIFSRDDRLSFIETRFRDSNFLHLTGVSTKMNSFDFYKACIDNKLSERDFTFSKGSTSELKLEVLHQAMLIDKTAKMIGDYLNIGVNLYTQKMTGNIHVCMGFVKDNESGFYVPNTVLKEDIRKATDPTLKLLCVLKKSVGDREYGQISSIGRGVDPKELELPEYVIGKLSDGLKERFGLPVAPKPIIESSEADKTLDAVIEILDETIAEKNEAISERNKAIAERDEALAEFKQFRSEAMANSEEFNAIMKENPALKAAFKAARERHLESKDQKPTMPDKSAPNDTQTVKPKKPKR